MKPEEFASPNELVLHASIGQHTRHILEMYDCLLCGYGAGIVNYDERRRDGDLETKLPLAIALIDRIIQHSSKENRALLLKSNFHSSGKLSIQTNYERELHYNWEHTIHHMAIIRIGLAKYPHIVCDADFGVAPSTMNYRQAGAGN